MFFLLLFFFTFCDLITSPAYYFTHNGHFTHNSHFTHRCYAQVDRLNNARFLSCRCLTCKLSFSLPNHQDLQPQLSEKTLPTSTKTHRREGSHSRRGSECVCVSEGVWESERASRIEEEERERESAKGGEERREQVWTRWSSTNKPPRGCRVVSVSTGSAIRPWCPRAVRDPVPCWLWHSSWDAAWLPASARTTRSPSCSKGSVWWCATRTLPRTEG